MAENTAPEQPYAAPVHGAKIPALDGVRGMAILGVMLCHFMLHVGWENQSWWRLTQGGWLGVDLFFVLSGFLITGILIDTKGRSDYWPRFYRRRFLRIFPLYYFAVLVTWLTVILVEKAPERLHGYDSFGWFFAFASNIAMALKQNWLYHSHIFNLNHLWSLAVEEQFYLVWPLVIWLLPTRVVGALCAVIVIISPSLRLWTAEQFGQEWYNCIASYVLPYCRMNGLAAGAFLAIALRLEWHKMIFPLDRWIARFVLVYCAWNMARILLNVNELALGTYAALAFAALVWLALNDHPKALVRRIFENPFLVDLGKYSYALYIFHQMFEYEWKSWFWGPMRTMGLPLGISQLIYALLAFGGTYLLARVSWVLIEQPMLRLKR